MDKFLIKPTFQAPKLATGPNPLHFLHRSGAGAGAATGEGTRASAGSGSKGSLFSSQVHGRSQSPPRQAIHQQLRSPGNKENVSSSVTRKEAPHPAKKQRVTSGTVTRNHVLDADRGGSMFASAAAAPPTVAPRHQPTASVGSSSGAGQVADVRWTTITNSLDALSAFQVLLSSAAFVTSCILWPDYSTSHAASTIKYCSGQAMSCPNWNCVCDRHVRATQASKPIAGIIFNVSRDGFESEGYLLDLDSVQRSEGYTEAICGVVEACVSRKLPTVIYNFQLFCLAVQRSESFLSPSRQMYGRIYSAFQDNQSVVFDPRIATYLCSSDIAETELELAAIFRKYKIPVDKPRTGGSSFFEASSGRGSKDRVIESAVCELNALFLLYNTLSEELDSKGMNDLLYDIEIPLSMLLSKMESVGVSIDAVLMDEYLRKVESRIAEITTRAREMTSQPALNLGSSDQVSRLLYDHLKLPLPSQHTGTSGSKARKHPSTSEAELNRLLDKHPVVELILTYRALSRVQTSTIEGIKTFLVEYGKGAQPLSKPLPSFMNRSRESDVMAGPVYRLHAWWNQTNAATGRLSCSKPNLQAIPTAKSIDNVEMDLRSLFVASPG
jgi:hypothetical protein